ncbi:MAG: ROK family protein, partial [Erysipelotrichaceae bacterium]|nr:ROK family protein [Erysipelotrichaceae bacterium]
FESFLNTIEDLCSPLKNEVEGIAMAMPGFVDPESGICSGSGVFRYRHDPHVASIISERCGCPVIIENDGKAAALAEHEYGCLKGCRNAAVFVIGSGVGGGLIINSQLYRGSHHSAGELNYMATEARDYGSLEKQLGNQCSILFMLDTYRRLTGDEERLDGYEFFRRLPDDPNAQQALDEMCTNIAIQLHNLYWLLDLEKVAIGGGISAQQLVTERIREKFDEVGSHSVAGRRRYLPQMEIVRSQFGNDANLIGAFLTYQKVTDNN